MKTKTILIISVLLTFFSCEKDKDNPYETNNNTQAVSKYFFSDLERSFILFNETDSFAMLENETDTLYYQIKSIKFDTLVNADSVEYEDALVRINKLFPQYNYKIEHGFVHMTREHGYLQYYFTLERMFDEYADTLEPNRIIPYHINEHYNSIELFGKTFHDVYRVEEDSSSNHLGDCYQIRAWISPTEGIVCDEEACMKKVLLE